MPGPLRSAPSLRKQAALDWILSRYILFFQHEHTVYMSLSTGVYFTSTTAGRNDGEPFSPGSTEFSLPPHQSTTASLPTAECTAVSQPAKQLHLLGTIALCRARVNSHDSNALTCSLPLTCSTCPAINGAHAINLGSRIPFFFRADGTRWSTT